MSDIENHDFKNDIALYADIMEIYETLQDNDFLTAYHLKKKALIMADRFSDIRHQLRKMEKTGRVADPALKDRMLERYKLMKEIHTDARMIWARGKDENV